jgi:hypothetical protein
MTTNWQNSSGNRRAGVNNAIMKFVLTILCSLMFLGGQLAAMSVPFVCDGQPAHHCGCNGKMPCCAASPTSLPQAPVTATVPAGSQQQILSSVPAVVVWVLVTAGTPSISPLSDTVLKAGDAPLFVRHCAWLI